MMTRIMLPLISMIALFSTLTSACGHEFKKQLTGPDAVVYRTDQYARQRGRPGIKTREESLRVEETLVNEVNRYIDTYPQLPERKKEQLRKLIVHVGMTKEEVRLLLGEPFEVLTAPETLEGMAKDEWKDTQEAWVYRSYGGEKYYTTYIFYFRADAITHIIKIIPPVWWL